MNMTDYMDSVRKMDTDRLARLAALQAQDDLDTPMPVDGPMVTVRISRLLWEAQEDYLSSVSRDLADQQHVYDFDAAVMAADNTPTRTVVRFTGPLALVVDFINQFDYVGQYESDYVGRSLVEAGRRAAQSLVKQLRTQGQGDYGRLLDPRWRI